jgi:hypothetical protein
MFLGNSSSINHLSQKMTKHQENKFRSPSVPDKQRSLSIVTISSDSSIINGRWITNQHKPK